MANLDIIEQFPPAAVVRINPDVRAPCHTFHFMLSSGIIETLMNTEGIVLFRAFAVEQLILARCAFFSTRYGNTSVEFINLPVEVLRPADDISNRRAIVSLSLAACMFYESLVKTGLKNIERFPSDTLEVLEEGVVKLNSGFLGARDSPSLAAFVRTMMQNMRSDMTASGIDVKNDIRSIIRYVIKSSGPIVDRLSKTQQTLLNQFIIEELDSDSSCSGQEESSSDDSCTDDDNDHPHRYPPPPPPETNAEFRKRLAALYEKRTERTCPITLSYLFNDKTGILTRTERLHTEAWLTALGRPLNDNDQRRNVVGMVTDPRSIPILVSWIYNRPTHISTEQLCDIVLCCSSLNITTMFLMFHQMLLKRVSTENVGMCLRLAQRLGEIRGKQLHFQCEAILFRQVSNANASALSFSLAKLKIYFDDTMKSDSQLHFTNGVITSIDFNETGFYRLFNRNECLFPKTPMHLSTRIIRIYRALREIL